MVLSRDRSIHESESGWLKVWLEEVADGSSLYNKVSSTLVCTCLYVDNLLLGGRSYIQHLPTSHIYYHVLAPALRLETYCLRECALMIRIKQMRCKMHHAEYAYDA